MWRLIIYRAQSDLALPVRGLRVYLETSTVSVYSGSERSTEGRRPLGSAALRYYEGLAAHVRVVAGVLPHGDDPPSSASVAVPLAVAATLHLHLGQRLVLAPDGRHVE